MHTNQKGFTLIELLVVVLIIGILAAMAMPQYFKAVERSRMTEAVTLLGNIAQAQQRKYLQINRYTSNFRGLDVAPKGANNTTYYTKGNPETGYGGNGFAVVINGGDNITFVQGFATAERVALGSTGDEQTLQYNYTLKRFYASNDTQCDATDENGKALCADFCGIDTPVATCCSDGTSTACTTPTTGNESSGSGSGGGSNNGGGSNG